MGIYANIGVHKEGEALQTVEISKEYENLFALLIAGLITLLSVKANHLLKL
jgi:hypothetical protein